MLSPGTTFLVVATLLTAGWILYALVRALVAVRRAAPPPTASESFSRAEKLRQQIRRKIVERRANPSAPAAPAAPVPPPARPPSAAKIPPVDPFGGRRSWWRRWWQGLTSGHGPRR